MTSSSQLDYDSNVALRFLKIKNTIAHRTTHCTVHCYNVGGIIIFC